MFYIGEGIEFNYIKADEGNRYKKFINEKKFTVKDTPLSYRQVNTLSDDNLLNEDRANNKGWRKFSFKELVFILMVDELKKFGINHYQLKELSDYFLSKDYSYLADLAIGCVLGQIEITVNIYTDGKVDVFDPNFYTLIRTNQPHISITLNDIVNKLAVKASKTPFPIKYSIKKAYSSTKMQPKEEEILKLIRNNSYSDIVIKKKNGEVSIVHAKRENSSNSELSREDILNIVNARQYQNISLVERDGKIVSHTIEETIKL